MRAERGAVPGGEPFVKRSEHRKVVRVRVGSARAEERIFRHVQQVQLRAECSRQFPAVFQRGAGGRGEVGDDENLVQPDHNTSTSGRADAVPGDFLRETRRFLHGLPTPPDFRHETSSIV